MAVDQSLIERIATSLRTTRASVASPTDLRATSPGTEPREKSSILSRAAELYATRPTGDEDTPPTGFDPAAAALFEALVEGAYLVAHADGEFDDDERMAFEQVVFAATNHHLDAGQIGALLADLEQLYKEDGVDKRVQFVSGIVTKAEQQHEVLRVAALMGYISGGVSAVERATMERLAAAFGLGAPAVDRAIDAARAAIDADVSS